MKKTIPATHINEDGYLVIYRCVLPIKLKYPKDESFVPPDLERALFYYSNFINQTKLSWTPARYLEEVVGEVSKRVGNGYYKDKAKIMNELFLYLGNSTMEKFFYLNTYAQ